MASQLRSRIAKSPVRREFRTPTTAMDAHRPTTPRKVARMTRIVTPWGRCSAPAGRVLGCCMRSSLPQPRSTTRGHLGDTTRDDGDCTGKSDRQEGADKGEYRAASGNPPGSALRVRQQPLMVLGGLPTSLRYRHRPRRGNLSRVAHLAALTELGVLLIAHRRQADLRHPPTIAAHGS